MGPPFYADLGKNARDLLVKGYHFMLFKLDVKTKTNTGVEFNVAVVQNLETKNVVGALETKYKFKEYGVTFMEKWNTDNMLATEISIADFCEGAKLACETSFTPFKGDKSLRLKGEFKNETVALNIESDFKTGGPFVKGSAVLGYGGWLCGFSSIWNAGLNEFIERKGSMGFATKDFVLNTSITEGKIFGGSLYHKVSDKVEGAVLIAWSMENKTTELSIACKYNLDPDAALRCKLNTESLIGFGYSQKLKEGVTVYLSAQLDGKNIKEGGHGIGICIELEA